MGICGWFYKWTPCSKQVCGLMWQDIRKYTLAACMPWNVTGFLPYSLYFAWLASGRKWSDDIITWLNTAYAVHTLYLLTLFIITPIMINERGDIDDPRWNSAFPENFTAMDFMNALTYAHTWCFLSSMWGLTVTLYNPWTGYGKRCCCQPVAAARFFAFWMFVAIVFDAPNVYFQIALISAPYYHYYYIAALIINCYDILILIPIVHWAYAAAQETKRKFDEKGYPEVEEGKGTLVLKAEPAA